MPADTVRILLFISPLFRLLKFCSSVRYICVVSLKFSIWLQLFRFAPQPLMKVTLGSFIFSSLNRFCVASRHTLVDVFIQLTWSCGWLDDLLSSGFWCESLPWARAQWCFHICWINSFILWLNKAATWLKHLVFDSVSMTQIFFFFSCSGTT